MPVATIIDVDTGSDDAWAILLLLWGESRGNYLLKGITCCKGNTSVDNVCRNTLRVLETVGRQDVPVYRGAEECLLNLTEQTTDWHGIDGFGDKDFPEPHKKIEENNAIEGLLELATKHKEIDLICTGPLTNLALALKVYPSIKKHIRQVYIMGGNTTAVGNVKNTTSEFNFHTDPESARIVLNSLTCPIKLLPWETCLNVPISHDWRFNVLGDTNLKAIVCLNEVEQDLYANYTTWVPCDALLAGIFINQNVAAKTRKAHVTVELNGQYTRGQGVINPYLPANVELVEHLNCDLFKSMLLEMRDTFSKS